jgi:protein-L-isoaspartate(D-aspartate) O-methyltransferase
MVAEHELSKMAIPRNTSKTGIGMTSSRTRERMLTRLREQGIQDEVVINVMAEIPRHIFVDEALSIRAYEDVSLPIGYGQTISQPYIVAKMTQILRNGKQLNKVLEIGTGCGYQTAVLSRVSNEVFSLERIRPLVMKARTHLRTLKCTNVKLDHADGSIGLKDYGPFDAIMVTAASSHVPQELVDQLAVGGRMVIPVGTAEQVLHLIERTAQGVQKTALEPVKFVPLLGGTALS